MVRKILSRRLQQGRAIKVNLNTRTSGNDSKEQVKRSGVKRDREETAGEGHAC